MNHTGTILNLANKCDSFYLYDETNIQENISRLQNAFPQIQFLYSVKCNPNNNILHSVLRKGFGVDAASLGEVKLARKEGIFPDKIYFSAPGKSLSDIESCINNCILIADSIGEMQRIQAVAQKLQRTVSIGIRINPTFAQASSKFGIDEDQALSFLRISPCDHIKVIGIHVHLKSQILDAEILATYYKRMLSLADRVSEIVGTLDFVNMGSGLGIPYSSADIDLDISALGKAVSASFDAFKASHKKTKLIIEVGRYAVCKSGTYVTKVIDRKISHGKTFIVVKNTLNGFIRPSLSMLVQRYADDDPAACEPLFTSKDAFKILTLKQNSQQNASLETVTIVGNLCTAADVIAEDVSLPRLENGDLILIPNAGAYGAALTPFQFSSQEKPAEFFLSSNGEVIETL